MYKMAMTTLYKQSLLLALTAAIKDCLQDDLDVLCMVPTLLRLGVPRRVNASNG